MPKSKKSASGRKKPAVQSVKQSKPAPAAVPEPAASVHSFPARLFRRQPRPQTPRPTHRLPSAWLIARRALKVIADNRWLFLGIASVYTVLNILLVRGFSDATDLGPLRDLLSGSYPGGVGQIGSSLALFGILVAASGGNASDVAGAYQTFLLLITSLAIVWALRQVMSGKSQVRIRDSFYKGMYPLVPVILVFLVVLVHCLPLIIGGSLYGLVVTNGIAVTALERGLWMLLLLAGLALTVYLLTASIFAGYIAALPDMTPRRALRSARELVRYRRLPVLRKLLFLPLALLLVSAIIMLPIIWFLTPLAPWVFFILSMVSIVIVHAYLYTLYRELLV
ncbi:MAG TPA: hypothetical protein VK978_00910 [Candidatus Saccharimonadales bacterium]|nr:hypothetical protein [Candidatus Saccharimonadales bacterium]